MTLSQAQEIHEVAQKIDNAENEVLKRLKIQRTKQAQTELITKAQEIQKKGPVFEVEKDAN